MGTEAKAGPGDGRVWLLATCLSFLIAAAFLASLSIGPAALPVGEVLSALFTADASPASIIVVEVRLPRALLAVLIGGALGLCGAALQGFLRNPLAEPGLIGVSAAAALGAVLSLYFGLAAGFLLALPLAGMAGACIAVGLLYVLAGRTANPLTLILAGIAVNSIAGAATALALNLAPSPYAVMEIVFWMLGALTDRTLDHVWLAAPFILAGGLLLLALGRGLDALTLGEEVATSLGHPPARLRWLLIGGTALAVGAATSVAGVIGFVGLVVPHILRPLVGHRPGRLLWASALGGALLLLVADIVARVALPDREVKLGVVTAIVGAPFFLHLVLRARSRLI